METRAHPALRSLCHQAKNIYNRANYLYKQSKGKGKFLNYYELDKFLKHEQCYKLLPAHTAQHT
ncbi:MAG: RNA-guided endonuclease TnpB family protein, partial [Candidatus Heimdallarchaeaceae archaeon]